jgi:transposase
LTPGWCGSVLDRLNRHDLTDEEWERLRVFLPADPPRGGRWADHRMAINGIFFRTRTGCPWRDLTEGFGNWKTVYNLSFNLGGSAVAEG